MRKRMRNIQKKSTEFLKTEEHSGNSPSNVGNSYLLIKMQNLGKNEHFDYRFFSPSPILSP